jgi:hypothetical protein
MRPLTDDDGGLCCGSKDDVGRQLLKLLVAVDSAASSSSDVVQIPETHQSTSPLQLKSMLLSYSLVLLVAVPDEVDFWFLLSWGGWSSDVHVILGLALLQEDVHQTLVLVLLRQNNLRLRGGVLACLASSRR